MDETTKAIFDFCEAGGCLTFGYGGGGERKAVGLHGDKQFGGEVYGSSRIIEAVSVEMSGPGGGSVIAREIRFIEHVVDELIADAKKGE